MYSCYCLFTLNTGTKTEGMIDYYNYYYSFTQFTVVNQCLLSDLVRCLQHHSILSTDILSNNIA